MKILATAAGFIGSPLVRALPSVALRTFNVYGPGRTLSNPYPGVAAIFSARLLNGKAPLVNEYGNQTRDFVSEETLTELSERGLIR